MDIEQKLIDKYYKLLENESKIKKYLTLDQINRFSEIIGTKHKFIKHSYKIKNPVELVLEFYKEKYPTYYQLIIDGINDNRIVFNIKEDTSYTNSIDGKCYIHFEKTDADIFMVAHEFGHYIDLNSNQTIFNIESYNYGEILSIYMEKQLSNYLIEKYGLNELVNIRRKNRLHFDENILKIARLEYKYENIYLSGKLLLTDLDVDNILKITRMYSKNIINHLIAYPLGNIYSEYLLDNGTEIDNNLQSIIESLDIDYLLVKYTDKFKSEGKNNEKKGISSFLRKIR